ncbi:hypothetical protein BBAD15_g12057 [Beauveria bassiana D1-5]|uniref:Uncharacterized protein n=1 Tax=Beauveria bassiana D1-5 TaxID=1245745 RepID=A0A0A2VPK7_BEABA|nr:hypothetical protein BBAD15_g12057 [Beauveria bassiana D1-5]
MSTAPRPTPGQWLGTSDTSFRLSTAPTNAANDVACIVSGLKLVAHSGLPTAWRKQKIVRVVADRAVSPVILLHKRVLPQSELGRLPVGQGVLPHRSLQEILNVRAVDVVGLARQGADEAHAPVAHPKQRHDVGTLVAEKLSLSEPRPAWAFVPTCPSMRCFGPSSRSARQLKQSCSTPVRSTTVLKWCIAQIPRRSGSRGSVD